MEYGDIFIFLNLEACLHCKCLKWNTADKNFERSAVSHFAKLNWSFIAAFNWNTISSCSWRGCKTAGGQSWRFEKHCPPAHTSKVNCNGWNEVSEFFQTSNSFVAPWATRIIVCISFNSPKRWTIQFNFKERNNSIERNIFFNWNMFQNFF